VNQPLTGVTVGVVENRFSRELATLFEKAGARVDAVPLFEERYPDDLQALDAFIESAAAGQFDDLIFTTGSGFRFVRRRAETTGRWDSLLASLRVARLISRSPKVNAALRAADLAPAIQAADGTTAGIQDALRDVNLRGRRIAVQLFNAEPLPLVAELIEREGAVVTVQPYIYAPVSDPIEVESFIRRVISAQVEVLALTSAPQVRVLVEAAERSGLRHDFIQALSGTTSVASVGKVTTEALAAYGITPRIVPDVHKMGPLVTAVVEAGIGRRVSA
jgi:uroporphyrinogen-III synthase